MQWNLVFHDSYNDELWTLVCPQVTPQIVDFLGTRENVTMKWKDQNVIMSSNDEFLMMMMLQLIWVSDGMQYDIYIISAVLFFFLPKKSSILMSYQAFKFNFPVCRILRGQRNMLSDTTNPESESNDRTIVFFTRSVLCEKRTMLHNKV